MKNRLVALTVFIVIAVITLLASGYINNTKSVDLSELKIDKLSIGDKFNQKGFELNRDIQIERYQFYFDEAHPNFIVKVDKKSQRVKGLMLIKDKKIKTNQDFTVGDSIDDAIQALGSGYKMNKGKKDYKTLTYSDKDHHLNLKVLYQNNEIRRIEFYKW